MALLGPIEWSDEINGQSLEGITVYDRGEFSPLRGKLFQLLLTREASSDIISYFPLHAGEVEPFL